MSFETAKKQPHSSVVKKQQQLRDIVCSTLNNYSNVSSVNTIHVILIDKTHLKSSRAESLASDDTDDWLCTEERVDPDVIDMLI